MNADAQLRRGSHPHPTSSLGDWGAEGKEAPRRPNQYPATHGEAGAAGSERDKANDRVSLEKYTCSVHVSEDQTAKTAHIDGGKLEIKTCCCCRHR